MILVCTVFAAHSVIVSTYGIVCLEMGDVSKLIAVQNALKSRPLLKKVHS